MREARWSGSRFNSLFAFVVTLIEVLLTVILVRFAYRCVMKLFAWAKARVRRDMRPATAPTIPIQAD